MTNREWLDSLSDEEYAKFIANGLLVKLKGYDGKPIYGIILPNFSFGASTLCGHYMASEKGIKEWLCASQSYEVVK